MPFSKKNKIFLLFAVLGLITFTVIYFYRDYRDRNLTDLKQDFEAKIEQAEEYRNIQLDTARIYAKEALDLVEGESSLEFEKNTALLSLSDIDFLRTGASEGLYERVEKCEEWFSQKKLFSEVFKSKVLKLQIKGFLRGNLAVRDDLGDLINSANRSGLNDNKAEAYHLSMLYRDFTREWDEDVYLLDSARRYARLANDSVCLSKNRVTDMLENALLVLSMVLRMSSSSR